ncbi:MAG: hypothetical protein ACT4OK_16680 [Gemmobacter sp.]
MTWSRIGGVVALQLPLLIVGLLLWLPFHFGMVHERLVFPMIAAAFLAVLTPVVILVIRHQIRLTRVALIELFAKTFGLVSRPAPVGAAGKPDSRAAADTDNVSFEFVRDKYFADLFLQPQEPRSLDRIPPFAMSMRSDWMLLFCAVPYMVLIGFGAFLMLLPVMGVVEWPGPLARLQPLFMEDPAQNRLGWLHPGLLSSGGLSTETLADAEKLALHHSGVLTVAAFAFAGSYCFTLRMLLRAVAVFDLSPLTFLRSFAHSTLSVASAIVLYRTFPDAERLFTPAAGGTSADEVNSLWLLVAFALGFLPDTAAQMVQRLSRISHKATYSELDAHTKTIPLTLLDGIDPMTAYRLDEAGIHDVQNLATFNPIMLHVESPFGIYQSMDWIAQAQLCTIVGPERFLLLKSVQIRTVFDLERAMLPVKREAVLQQPDGELRAMVGELLQRGCARDATARQALGITPAAMPVLATDAALEALARVMLDDLHVWRLRQVWHDIYRKFHVGATPGDQAHTSV